MRRGEAVDGSAAEFCDEVASFCCEKLVCRACCWADHAPRHGVAISHIALHANPPPKPSLLMRFLHGVDDLECSTASTFSGLRGMSLARGGDLETNTSGTNEPAGEGIVLTRATAGVLPLPPLKGSLLILCTKGEMLCGCSLAYDRGKAGDDP